MQVKRVASSLLVLVSLLLPTVTQAAITTVHDQLVTITNTSAYRFKDNRLWQLSTFNAQKVIQQKVFNDVSYIVTEQNNNSVVYASTDGLQYDRLVIPQLTNILLRDDGTNLFILGDSGTALNTYRLELSGEIVPLSPILGSSVTELVGITQVNGTDLLLIQRSTNVETYKRTTTSWIMTDSVSCLDYTFFTLPVPGVFCTSSQQFFQATATGSLERFFSEDIQLISADQLLVGVSITSGKLLITDGRLITSVQYDSSQIGLISAVEVVGARVFIKSAHLYELQWQGNVGFSLMDASNTAKLVTENGSSSVYIVGTNTYYSASATSIIPVTVTDVFDQAAITSMGTHLLWKQGGSFTSAAGSNLLFSTIATVWAKSSQIVGVYEHNNITYILLINSSNNYNLYSTQTFESWTKITLPTHPTNVVSIEQARALPAGSLVETHGTITAVPGVVADNILYIQSELSGIQVYLSTSKGLLPNMANANVIVTGEISSSSAKRVLLNEPADISVTGKGTIEPVAVTTSSLSNYLGVLVTLRSRISLLVKDYFNFDSTKVHAALDANKFTVGDLIATNAVADVNSSSGNVELWQVGSPELVESAPSVPNVVPDVKTPTTGLVNSTAKSSTSIKAASTTLVKQPEGQSSQLTLVSDAKGLSQSTTANNSQVQTMILLSALSFLTGSVVTRGKRFKG